MTSPQDDPAERFSNRVGPYMRGRPEYPQNAIDLLRQRGFMGPGVEVADIGAGTGILSRQALEEGSTVWAIEPSDAMRSVAEAQLGTREEYHCIAGSAEDTSLPDGSIDAVLCGQSFHWFDLEGTREEFSRILRRPKRVGLLWNMRAQKTPFMTALEKLVERHSIDYEEVVGGVQQTRKTLDDFYGGTENKGYTYQRLSHHQDVGFPDLEALVSSFSYMPKPGSDAHVEAMKELRELWQEHEEDGQVRVEYDTHLVWGLLSPGPG